MTGRERYRNIGLFDDIDKNIENIEKKIDSVKKYFSDIQKNTEIIEIDDIQKEKIIQDYLLGISKKVFIFSRKPKQLYPNFKKAFFCERNKKFVY